MKAIGFFPLVNADCDIRPRRTVDSDGDRLGEDEAVGTLEGGDQTKMVELKVVGRDTFGGLCVHNLEIKAVDFGNSPNRSGAGVALEGMST